LNLNYAGVPVITGCSIKDYNIHYSYSFSYRELSLDSDLCAVFKGLPTELIHRAELLSSLGGLVRSGSYN